MTGCSGLALTVGGNLIPELYKTEGIDAAFRSGIYFCLFSCAMAYSFLGIEKCLNRKKPVDTIQVANEQGDDDFQEVENKEIEIISEEVPTRGCATIKSFEAIVWLICADGALTYASMMVQTVLGSELLKKRFNYDTVDSSFTIDLPFTICIVMMPLLGLLIDRVGHRMTLLYIQIVLTLIGILILILLPDQTTDTWQAYLLPKISFVFFGFQYSVWNIVHWGSLPFCMPETS